MHAARCVGRVTWSVLLPLPSEHKHIAAEYLLADHSCAGGTDAVACCMCTGVQHIGPCEQTSVPAGTINEALYRLCIDL
jgi:hypothetical protein